MMKTRLRTQPKAATASFTPVAGALLLRKCACGGSAGAMGECSDCSDKNLSLQRSTGKVNSATQASNPGPQSSNVEARNSLNAPPIVHEVLRTPGQPLDRETRALMEPRFGHDFGNVRVHDDTQAGRAAYQMNALAYTVGHHVVFGAGQYRPDSERGQRLLAHELAHTIQQSATGRDVHPQLEVSRPNDRAELEADAMATLVLQGRTSTADRSAEPGNANNQKKLSPEHVNLISTPMIQRQEDPAPTPGWGLGELMRWIQCLPGTSGNPMTNPLADISVFQSPGASGWWGAKFGCYRNNCARRHRGWDLHATSGTEVRAVSAGTTTHHTDAAGYGSYIILTTKANPQRTYLYGHLSQREPAGDYCPGDKIGATGTSGNASADRPHLHFEVRDAGAQVDPATYLTEPGSVIEASGSAAVAIDKALPAPCNQC